MIIGLILLLGLILRLVNLSQSLWLDEAVQAITASGPLKEILTELTGDFHPPLYHFFLWFWVRLFGSSELALRLPSVIFGTFTIYIVYLLADLIFPKKIFRHITFAHLSAFLLSVSQFHIYYSQEARPYALATFLVATSYYFFVRRKWFWYLVVTTLALYSSYYVFFILLAQGIIIIKEGKNKVVTFLFCYGALFFLFLPWLPSFVKQLQVGRQALLTLPEWGNLVNASFVEAVPLTFVKFTLGRITIFDENLYAIVALSIILLYGAVIARGLFRGKQFLINNQQLTIVFWLVIPILFALFISIFTPNYQPFRLLITLPAFFLLLGMGTIGLKRAFLITILFLMTSVSSYSLFTYYTNSFFQREDWRRTVQFIDSQDKAIVILPSLTSNWPLRYYTSKEITVFGVTSEVRQIEERDLKNLKIEQVNNLVIYYIRYLQPVFDPQEKILTWLQGLGYTKESELSFNQISVWEYRLANEDRD